MGVVILDMAATIFVVVLGGVIIGVVCRFIKLKIASVSLCSHPH